MSEGEIVEVYVDGHDIAVEITTYVVVPPWRGSAHTAPSDLDYYGYTDLEYNIRSIEGEDFMLEGDDLDLPITISSSSLDDAVAEKLNKAKDDGY